MRKKILFPVLIASAVLLTSCEKVVFKPQPGLVSFSEFVIPLVQEKCATCHEGQTPDHAVWADSASLYATFLTQGVIDTTTPSNGLLYKDLKGSASTHHVMGYLTSAQTDTLTRWVDEGTKEFNTVPLTSFIREVAPEIVSKCASCHGTWKPAESLYQTLVSEGILNPDNVKGCALYKALVDGQPAGMKLPPAQNTVAVKWLNEGALNN